MAKPYIVKCVPYLVEESFLFQVGIPLFYRSRMGPSFLDIFCSFLVHMDFWEQTLAFGFVTDFERKEAGPPTPARTAVLSLELPAFPTGTPFDVMTACVFAVYSKCEGDDAVLAIDGKPPTAIVNPFSKLGAAPFQDAVHVIHTTRQEKSESKARGTLATQLEERSKASASQASNALVASGSVLMSPTFNSIGDVACAHAFDCAWVIAESGTSVDVLLRTMVRCSPM